MVKSEEKSTQNATTPKAESMIIQMIATMADTTWRMFVPILGLLGLGVYGDKSLHSFPGLTLLGFVVGIGISVLLIRNQLKKGTA